MFLSKKLFTTIQTKQMTMIVHEFPII